VNTVMTAASDDEAIELTKCKGCGCRTSSVVAAGGRVNASMRFDGTERVNDFETAQC
jgi:hypothetical protein